MTEVVWDEAPSLQSPLLVVAFEGWFDAGECATGAIQWIIDHYEARRVARIDPEEFFDFQENRPLVEIGEDAIHFVVSPNSTVNSAGISKI